MKQDSVNYLMVGVFVLGMLALLMVVLYRVTGADATADSYHVEYSNVTGISKGSLVTYSGYSVGHVKKVMPVRSEGKTLYRLQLAVREGWKIPVDSVARIITPGLLSDNLVDIEEGNSSEYLEPGADLNGEEEMGIVAVLNSMASEIQDIADKSIKPLIANIDEHVGLIGSDLSSQIPTMTASINVLLQRLNESAERVNTILGNESQQRIDNILRNADTATENLVALSLGFDEARKQLDHLLMESNEVVAGNKQDVRTSVESLRNAMGSVAKNIDTILYNLEATSRNMNEFSRQVRENPGVLLSGSPQKDNAR